MGSDEGKTRPRAAAPIETAAAQSPRTIERVDTTGESEPLSAVEDSGVRITIGAKLGMVTVIIIAAFAFVAAVGLTRREYQNLVEAKQHTAEMELRLFTLSVFAAIEFDDAIAAQESVDRLAKDPEVVEIGVWSATGDEVIASFSASHPEANRQPDAEPLSEQDVPASKPEVLDRRPTVGNAVETITTADAITMVAPIVGTSEEALGVVRVKWSLAREQEAFEESRALILQSAAIASALAWLLFFAVTRLVVVRPLNSLVGATRHLERGEVVELNGRSHDELGRLARAFTRMAHAIVHREHRIEAARRDLQGLLDNMGQAIMTIGTDYRVGPRHSKFAQSLLGPGKIFGRDARELLLTHMDPSNPEREAFEFWLEAVFSATPASWPKMAALAPGRIELEKDGTQFVLDLAFRPVFEGEQLTQLMVIATDVTEKLRLARHAEEQRSAHERELMAMRRIVASGTLPFAAFLRSAQQRLDRIEVLVPDNPNDLSVETLGEMFRHAHTIKGEARTFGLAAMEESAARLEDTLSRTMKPRSLAREVPMERRTELVADLATARQKLAESRALLVEASPLGEDVLAQVTVSNDDLSRVVELVQGQKGALAEAVIKLAARPFAECVAGLSDSAPTWAGALGRRARIELSGGAVRVPADLAQSLRGCITHLVRNAIAHGIEPAEERVASGKSEIGVVWLRAVVEGSNVVVEVEDDGRGLSLDKLRERALALGLTPPSDPRDLPFLEGLTTESAVGSLSGRGVGLTAVRQELREHGYELVLAPGPNGVGTLARISRRGPTGRVAI